ncbi:twin-arginine translocase TatA/TatE family subunit [Altericroceibacterium xinjiangense]|uniref:twin-arginine translocase TatA/TatE family subunit n=1 Tax=Altericroceibacterium xinjiangense TaxID=762261 RepID=UPI000F7DAD41|nr:twin-arginine translocase TatA/TatE family subunit [Altericroceibacterium xinjiangense]
MGSFSLVHWLVVGGVALVLFGKGRISETMGDFGKGIRSFRHGLAEDEPRKPEIAPKDAQQVTEGTTADRPTES